MRTYKILPVLILIICSSCKTDYEKGEAALIEMYSASVPSSGVDVKPLSAIQAFEDELLKRGILGAISKESYLRLIQQVALDSIKIDTKEIAQENGAIQSLSNPLMIASLLKSYEGIRAEYNLTDKNHSIVKIANVTTEIETSGDLGNLRLNQQLIDQINDEDFEKIIYRAPFIAIIYDIAERNYIKNNKNAR